MFKDAFNNPVFRFFRTLGNIWILDLIFVVTSLPIITIGASATALVYASMKMLEDEGYPAQNYFRSFKENFRQATGIWVIYAAIGSMLAAALIVYHRLGAGGHVLWAIALACCVLYTISLSYVFAIQSKFVNKIANTIRFSLVLPFHHVKETLLMLVTIAAVVCINVTGIFLVNLITINIGFGFIAYIFSVYYTKIFEHYIPKAEESDAFVEAANDYNGLHSVIEELKGE